MTENFPIDEDFQANMAKGQRFSINLEAGKAMSG